MAIYDLPGTGRFPQVEPSAGHWSRCSILHTVQIAELPDELLNNPYPANSPNELGLLKKMNEHRDDPEFFKSHVGSQGLSAFLSDPAFFDEPPVGAVLRRFDPANPRGLTTGLELATLFEAETPGLWHHHVLNVFFDPRKRFFGGPAKRSPADLSPPLQALVWATLDTAISSALMAAWRFKWVAEDDELQDQKQQDQNLLSKPRIAYRARPREFDESFNVLFDSKVQLVAGRFLDKRAGQKSEPQPSPGTPRHPAYPSGHSTYSAAASYVLGCLFPEYEREFASLAENIGYARLWGGVHWLSDHEFGQEVGTAIGKLVIEQLDATGIEGARDPLPDPPKPEKVYADAKRFSNACDSATSDFCKGVWRSTDAHGQQQNSLV